MARTIKAAVGPFRTAATEFDRGHERPVETTLYPSYIEVRLVGTKERYHVTYQAIVRHGAEQQIRHRIRRGAV
jgi:hypothetical protein